MKKTKSTGTGIRSLLFAAIAACLLFISVFAYGGNALAASQDETYTGKPSWYKEGFTSADLFHNAPSDPRVVDYAGVFSDAQKSALENKLAGIKTRTGMDVVVVTDKSMYGMEAIEYAAEFYDMNGYGAGDDHSGVVMFISFEPGNRQWFTAGTGKAEKLLGNSDNINIMDDAMEPYMLEGDYYSGVNAYMDKLSVLLEKGKFPRPFMTSLLYVGIALIAGSIFGGINLSSKKAGMRAVAPAVAASSYLKPDTFRITRENDTFIRTDVARALIESSRSGGGSNTGSYHSSGGHSFSGGGRRF